MWVGAAVAVLAFASNSLLNRAALDGGSIDAASFTAARIVSGAAMLALLVSVRPRSAGRRPVRSTATSASFLFAYAGAFSFAYLRIGAGTGALLLFGAVQIVIYGRALLRGERPGPLGWLALAIASGGVVALVAPGVEAPDPVGAVLMIGAGVAWGLYTLRGRGVTDPILATAGNFLYAVPLALLLVAGTILLSPGSVHADAEGLALAAVSGAFTSALGYALWYSVLPHLTAIQSGIVQLAPPPIAIVGGLMLLGERLTLRVVIASVLVLAGVCLGLVAADRGGGRSTGGALPR